MGYMWEQRSSLGIVPHGAIHLVFSYKSSLLAWTLPIRLVLLAREPPGILSLNG